MNPVTLATILLAQGRRGAVIAFLAVAGAFVAALWKAYNNKIVLGAAIFAFSATGLAMIIWSHVVAGWNQAALLGFGTSLLIVGTVELGIVGVLNKLTDPDHTKDLYSFLSQRFDELQNHLGIPAIQQAESEEPREPPDDVQQERAAAALHPGRP